MKQYTIKKSITIGNQNLADITLIAKKDDRSVSKQIDIAVEEYLDKHDSNRKMKRILKKRNGKK